MENNTMVEEVMETAVIEDKTNETVMMVIGLAAGYGIGRVIEFGVKKGFKAVKPVLTKVKDHIPTPVKKKSEKVYTVDVDAINEVESDK